jgi:hypothetical protein
MKLYRRKPAPIEAMQWDGTDGAAGEIEKWSDGRVCLAQVEGGLVIREWDGSEKRAFAGDWVIKGSRGDFYSYTNDVFEALYEVVE